MSYINFFFSCVKYVELESQLDPSFQNHREFVLNTIASKNNIYLRLLMLEQTFCICFFGIFCIFHNVCVFINCKFEYFH